jgi:hypothetical protein
MDELRVDVWKSPHAQIIAIARPPGRPSFAIELSAEIERAATSARRVRTLATALEQAAPTDARLPHWRAEAEADERRLVELLIRLHELAETDETDETDES